MRQTETFLCLALETQRSEVADLELARIYRELGDVAAWEVAQKNQMLPMIAHALKDAIPSSELPQRWLDVHNQAQKRAALFFSEVERVAKLLEAGGIPVAIIENGSVLKATGHCLGCFSSGDLDLLIEPAYAVKAGDMIIHAGYQPDTRRSFANARQEYTREFPDGVKFWLNLQWFPFMRLWTSSVENWSVSDMISVSQIIQNASPRLLPPTHNLLFCAIHHSIHAYIRPPGIRLCLDIDWIVSKQSIDWDIFIALALQFDCRMQVSLSFSLSQTYLKTPIPPYVMAQLAGTPAFVRRRDRLLGWLVKKGAFFDGSHKFNRLERVWLELNLHDRGPLAGLLSMIFPPFEWMRSHYLIRNRMALPYYYVKRLLASFFQWSPSDI